MIMYDTISHVCNPEIAIPKGYHTSEQVMENYFKILDKNSIPFDDLFRFCHFRDISNCTQLFQEVVTDNGICYTFNGIAHEEIFRVEK